MSVSSMYLANARTWITQFPPVEWALQRAREVAIGALRQGPIPEHVAFVMDGNRRFARSRQIETIEGHNLGFEALARILEVCYRSGVRVVTIYAFSIENFHRSKHEVEGLMGLAKLKLTQLAAHGELLARYGARIKILGNRELIRADVLEVVDRVEALTADNGDAILNVCFPYTSRDEMTTAVRSVVSQWATPTPSADKEKARAFSARHISQHIRSRHLAEGTSSSGAGGGGTVTGTSTGTSNGAEAATSPPTDGADAEPDSSSASASASATLHGSSSPPLGGGPSTSSPLSATYPDPELIDVATLNSAMHTAGMPPLRLLIRTSGVARFSDFMLWQAHEQTEVAFVPCMWPEFDLWRFLPLLVEWQWRQRHQSKGLNMRKRRGGAAEGKGVGEMEAASTAKEGKAL